MKKILLLSLCLFSFSSYAKSDYKFDHFLKQDDLINMFNIKTSSINLCESDIKDLTQSKLIQECVPNKNYAGALSNYKKLVIYRYYSVSDDYAMTNIGLRYYVKDKKEYNKLKHHIYTNGCMKLADVNLNNLKNYKNGKIIQNNKEKMYFRDIEFGEYIQYSALDCKNNLKKINDDNYNGTINFKFSNMNDKFIFNHLDIVLSNKNNQYSVIFRQPELLKYLIDSNLKNKN